MFSIANLVTLCKDAPDMGYLYDLNRKSKSLAHWECSVGTICVLNILSSVYVWSCDQPTYGLIQYCGKIMKNCTPSYSLHVDSEIPNVDPPMLTVNPPTPRSIIGNLLIMIPYAVS